MDLGLRVQGLGFGTSPGLKTGLVPDGTYLFQALEVILRVKIASGNPKSSCSHIVYTQSPKGFPWIY